MQQIPKKKQSILSDDKKIITTDTELEVFHWTKQRLAFLVKEDSVFQEIEKLRFKDYQGKFVVYYKKERKGRLFDFVEGSAGGVSPRYRFVWPDDLGVAQKETSTDRLTDIDANLRAAFEARILALQGE